MAEQPYTIGDLVYYSGLFAGMIAGTLTLRAYEAHHLVQLLGGVACGVVLGFVCDQIYQRMKAPPRGPGDDQGRYPPR